MRNEIMVSICCATYNHEEYIADAIESFLMQKTVFPLEILIHDDASTDGTAEVIKRYEYRYPNLIKAIYQTENQYSKGVDVGWFNMKRANGKYIALCEGDDYWIDPNKLQKQIDYMENHQECSLCVHAAWITFPNKNKLKSCRRPNRGNRIFTVDSIIQSGCGLFATNSFLFPKAKCLNMPKFYEIAPVGDTPLSIYLSLQGEVYYIDELMSVYRAGVINSWTDRIVSDVQFRISHFQKLINMYDELNRYTDYKYNNAIINKKKEAEFYYLLTLRLYKKARSIDFKDIYSDLGIRDKIKIFVRQYFPWIITIKETFKI